MTPDDWLEQYYTGEYFSGRFDFLKSFVSKYDLDQFDSIITIGGTNGKGETSRTLSRIFDENNVQHALWTSPHLKTVLERFQFSSHKIDNHNLIQIFESLNELSITDNTKFSYFEFLFISFLMLAKKLQIKTLILEVGLGGRLDAVNILDANIAAITSISRDHQDLLGNRFELILNEKLGITRSRQFLVTCFENDYLRYKTKKYFAKHNLELTWNDLFENGECHKTSDFSSRNQLVAITLAKKYFNHNSFKIPQFEMTAARCIEKIDSVSFTLFPSHNPDGVRKLVQLLIQRNYTNIDLMVLSFSDRSEEDISTMIKALRVSLKCPMILYEFHHFKAAKRDKLERIGKKFNLDITDDNRFYKQIEYSKKQHLLFTGSNYFLGHIMQKLDLTSSN